MRKSQGSTERPPLTVVPSVDYYRELLGHLAAGHFSNDKMIEISEMALLATAEDMYQKDGLNPLINSLVDLYMDLVEWKLEHDKASKHKMQFTTIQGDIVV